MLKAAESLSAAGHAVHVVSTNFVDWGTSADMDLRARLRLPWKVVDYSRSSGNWTRIRTGLRFLVCRRLCKTFGPERQTSALLGRATTRVLTELVKTAAGVPADLIYGGGGALIASVLTARRLKVPYAVDLEDFHGAEHSTADTEGIFSNRMARAAEAIVFRDAAFITTASDAIADGYAERYRKRPIVINNTFPLPAVEPEFARVDSAGLRLYWFSQTIGPGRGLEDAILAAGLADINCELHLRGNPSDGYVDLLSSMAKTRAPRLKLVHHPPEPPDRMVDLCRDYHVGLALELSEPPNRAICLTNKAFTYILAGLAVVFTDTPGQRSLAKDLGPGAFLYSPGDINTLAQNLKLWASSPTDLLIAQRASWAAARRRWHWQHPDEEGKLLRAVQEVLR